MTEVTERILRDFPSSNLTAVEKAALQNIEEISRRMDLTVQQEYQQINSVFDGLSESQKQQVDQFIRSELASPAHSTQ